jgi:MFS family permease
MAAPYVFLYLAQARHLGTAAVGLLLSAAGAATIVATPLIGVLIDLAGPRLILLAALLLTGAAGVGFGVSHGSVPLSVAAFGYALGQRVTTPAGATLLFGQIGPASRSDAFAVRYAAINTGACIGGLAGGLMIRPGHPATFQLAFIAQGAVCAAAAGVILLVSATQHPARPARHRDRDRPRRAGPGPTATACSCGSGCSPCCSMRSGSPRSPGGSRSTSP